MHRVLKKMPIFAHGNEVCSVSRGTSLLPEQKNQKQIQTPQSLMDVKQSFINTLVPPRLCLLMSNNKKIFH